METVNKTIVTEVEKYASGWTGGLPETPCGYGSKLDQTVIQREWIPRMVEKYSIQTIADIGAGDLNWMREMQWPRPVEYEAFDLVPRDPSVKRFDLIHEVPPHRDLLMCLWLLNHLPVEHAKAAQDNLLAAGSKYVMVTWWDEMDDYLDLPALEEVQIREDYNSEGKKRTFWLRLVKC